MLWLLTAAFIELLDALFNELFDAVFFVAFLAELMPTLAGYSMDVTRVTYADSGRLAFAELAETVTVNDSPLRTEESLVFELDADERASRIARIDIYIKTSAP